MVSLTISSIALVSTLLFLLVLKRRAPSLKLLDHPGGRKGHTGKTPLVGGLSIALVFLAALPVLNTSTWAGMALAISILLLIGVLDDLHDLPPLPKFVAQAFAALLLFYLAGPNSARSSIGALCGSGHLLEFSQRQRFLMLRRFSCVADLGVLSEVRSRRAKL